MRAIYLIILCFIVQSTFGKNDLPNWENPEVFAVNKENTRTTSIPYADKKTALTDVYSNSPYFQSLNGVWKFKWVSKVGDVPTGFHAESYDISNWDTMPVPGNWEFNGFGVPMYVNTGFGFNAKPPYIDREDSPVGAYRHTFNIPADWKSRRVYLHFEGGTNAMYVWVNGKEVGYTENSKSPAEFDITDYVREGKNTIACQVHKFSDASYIEDQDMWRLGGINRSVYLYSTDQTRILDFFAHPDLDKNYKDGLFSIDLSLKNYTSSSATQNVEVAILDANDKVVLEKKQSVVLPANGVEELTLSGTVKNPKKWTAETPNLYSLLITLKDNKNNVVEVTSHKIGFRKIEINDGQLFVNGKKVLFKGVNMHEFNVKTGQVVDEEVMMRNIQLMKELNINAVRTSHYPQPPLWYKLCDQYGLYLVDEANIESHGLGYGPDNVSNFPEWHATHMDRIYRAVERDKNHASVIFWSLGNEASNGKAFFDMYDWAKARDKSRPVQYEQAYQQHRNTDIICHMYPSWANMVRDAAKDLGRPYIMCEYAHAMGNSMGNFQDYWTLMRSSKNMQGGFIWEWYNQAFPTKDEQGRFYWGYGGDLNGYDRMNQDNFCVDGIITPDQQYMPHTYIVKKVYQNILFEAKDLSKGIITVINDYKFTDLKKGDYTYKWVILKNGETFAEGNFDVVIPADQRKDVKLAIPNLPAEDGAEYYLQVFAYLNNATKFLEKGFEVAKEEFAFADGKYFVAQAKDNGSLDISEADDKVTVTAGDVTYEFSTKNGSSLRSMKHDDKNVFRELPRLNFWRAPTDNDFGSWDQYTMRLWDAAGHNVVQTYKGKKQENGNITFSYLFKLRGIEAQVEMNYTVNKDGSLTVDANYKALSDDLPEMMRFGMVMSLNKEYDDFTWYGRGPHENYVDRKDDTFMGIWNGSVKDQAYPYIRPQETGNKTDVRWLSLKNKEGKGIKVEGAQPLSVSATNYKIEDLDPGMTKKQQHWSDVLPRHEVILNVDLFQRGVAGLNSWGAKPLDPYRFHGKEYNYSYTISVVK